MRTDADDEQASDGLRISELKTSATWRHMRTEV